MPGTDPAEHQDRLSLSLPAARVPREGLSAPQCQQGLWDHSLRELWGRQRLGSTGPNQACRDPSPRAGAHRLFSPKPEIAQGRKSSALLINEVQELIISDVVSYGAVQQPCWSLGSMVKRCPATLILMAKSPPGQKGHPEP